MSTLQIGLDWFPDGIGGGSSRFFSTLIDYLKVNCVHVRGIAAGTKPRIDSNGIRIVCAADAPLSARLRAARTAVREVLLSTRVDLVASHFALFTAASLDLIKQLPLVVHFHGPWAAESRVEGVSPANVLGRYFVERLVYARAARAIVLTRAFGDVLHRSYQVPLENIRVIPGGVDITRFNASCPQEHARMQLGLPFNRPIVLTVRRLVKRMGLENLILSLADVKKEHPDVVLVFVGGGSLATALAEQVRALHLERNVVFAGRVPEDDLPLYYRAANVSIVPSTALEGFGLVVAESLACGTPALVTPVGGLPEVVSGLSQRLILEDSSTRAIADGIRNALAQPLALPSADACQSYVSSCFSWPEVSARIKSVYKEVL